MADIKSIVDKIQKLRQLAKSDNVNEAAIAAKKAAELALEYQLTEAELEVKGEASEPIELNAENSIIYQSGRLVPWKSTLAIIICKHFGVYRYNHLQHNAETGRKINCYQMVGRKSDIQLCQYFFAYLVAEIDRLADRNVVQLARGVSVERLSYCRGAVDAIKIAFDQQKRAMHVNADPARSAAMVLVDSKLAKAEEVAYANIKGLKKYKIQTKQRFSPEHYSKGKEDGGRIQLNTGLGSGSGPGPSKLLK